MSLNWDIRQIDAWEDLRVFGDEDDTGTFVLNPEGKSWRLRTDIECLVWLSLSCGFDYITENNWREVFTRIAIVETITGAYRHESGTTEPRYFTPAEVRRAIGLMTNAARMTNAKFDKQVALMHRRAIEDQLRKEAQDGERGEGTQDRS